MNQMQINSSRRKGWFFCQVGAREHYLLPVLLHKQGRLNTLATDAWVRPGSFSWFLSHLMGKRGASMRGRFDEDLNDARVRTFPAWGQIRYLLATLSKRKSGRGHFDRPNKIAGRQFSRMFEAATRNPELRVSSIFAFSYTAHELFSSPLGQESFKVLGQIDGGPAHDEIIREVEEFHGVAKKTCHASEASFWSRWVEECKLADRIIVNSIWSKELVSRAVGDATKIRVVPLAYRPLERKIPERTRDLNSAIELLFLGNVTAGKGVIELITAMNKLRNAPVKLTIAGHIDPRLSGFLKANLPDSARLLGRIPRRDVHKLYVASDVFVFPSHSDGFGLTQLEAMAYGLPVIASKFCGEVVRDGIDGIILNEVTATSIVRAVLELHEERERIPLMRRAATQRIGDFSPDSILKTFLLATDADPLRTGSLEAQLDAR